MSRPEQVERFDSLVDAVQILSEKMLEVEDDNGLDMLKRAGDQVVSNLLGNGLVESEKYPSLIWDGNVWTLPESE